MGLLVLGLAIVIGLLAGFWLPLWITTTACLLVALPTLAFLKSLKNRVYVIYPSREILPPLPFIREQGYGRSTTETVLSIALEEKGFWYARPFAGHISRLLLLGVTTISITSGAAAFFATDNDARQLFAHIPVVALLVFLFGSWSPYAANSRASLLLDQAMAFALHPRDEPSLSEPNPMIHSLPNLLALLANLEARASEHPEQMRLKCAGRIHRMLTAFEVQAATEPNINVRRWRLHVIAFTRRQLGLEQRRMDALAAKEDETTPDRALLDFELRVNAVLDNLRAVEQLRAAVKFQGLSLYRAPNDLPIGPERTLRKW